EFAGELRLCSTRITGTDRIYKNHVRFRKPRRLVVLHFVRRRRQHPVIKHLYPPRPQRTQMQPNRSRSWSTVKREQQRTTSSRIVQRVGHVKNACLRVTADRV